MSRKSVTQTIRKIGQTIIKLSFIQTPDNFRLSTNSLYVTHFCVNSAAMNSLCVLLMISVPLVLGQGKDLCQNYHNCVSCTSESNCKWCGDGNYCFSIQPLFTGGCINLIQTPQQCPRTCNMWRNCKDCTSNNCNWCESSNTCTSNRGASCSYRVSCSVVQHTECQSRED